METIPSRMVLVYLSSRRSIEDLHNIIAGAEKTGAENIDNDMKPRVNPRNLAAFSRIERYNAIRDAKSSNNDNCHYNI